MSPYLHALTLKSSPSLPEELGWIKFQVSRCKN